MTKALVLFSGGADSVYMLLLALRMKREVGVLMFRYDQKHAEELKYARKILESDILTQLTHYHLGEIHHQEVDLTHVFSRSRSNLLKHSDPVNYPGVHEMHVPGRNGIFLFSALSIAESDGFDEIWIGCDYSDRVHKFPDCYQEWIVRMDELAQMSGSRKIQVKAPLLGLSKQDVHELLRAEGVDLQGIFSGYHAPKKKERSK